MFGSLVAGSIDYCTKPLPEWPTLPSPRLRRTFRASSDASIDPIASHHRSTSRPRRPHHHRHPHSPLESLASVVVVDSCSHSISLVSVAVVAVVVVAVHS